MRADCPNALIANLICIPFFSDYYKTFAKEYYVSFKYNELEDVKINYKGAKSLISENFARDNGLFSMQEAAAIRGNHTA